MHTLFNEVLCLHEVRSSIVITSTVVGLCDYHTLSAKVS